MLPSGKELLPSVEKFKYLLFDAWILKEMVNSITLNVIKHRFFIEAPIDLQIKMHGTIYLNYLERIWKNYKLPLWTWVTCTLFNIININKSKHFHNAHLKQFLYNL